MELPRADFKQLSNLREPAIPIKYSFWLQAPFIPTAQAKLIQPVAPKPPDVAMLGLTDGMLLTAADINKDLFPHDTIQQLNGSFIDYFAAAELPTDAATPGDNLAFPRDASDMVHAQAKFAHLPRHVYFFWDFLLFFCSFIAKPTKLTRAPGVNFSKFCEH